MALYYAQKGYYNKEGKYTERMERLKPFFKQPFLLHSSADVRITITEETGFTAAVTIGSLTATINQERYLVVRDDVVSSPSTE